MPDEKALFHTIGPSWSERSRYGGLRAVLSPNGLRDNWFLHGVHTRAAELAARQFPRRGYILDFGCGNGRFLQHFIMRGLKVLGTEITPEMIEAAKEGVQASEVSFALTDGISIPAKDESMDGIWCCAVLRYSLLVEAPAYERIAAEMFRVLRPGAYIFNCEMYLDSRPEPFLVDFLKTGFELHRLALLQTYSGKMEKLLASHIIPSTFLYHCGQMCAKVRMAFNDPWRDVSGLRDYLFVWRKPLARRVQKAQ